MNIFTVYAEKEGITFVMGETDEFVQVLGFYYGVPTPETAKYVAEVSPCVAWKEKQ